MSGFFIEKKRVKFLGYKSSVSETLCFIGVTPSRKIKFLFFIFFRITIDDVKNLYNVILVIHNRLQEIL